MRPRAPRAAALLAAFLGLATSTVRATDDDPKALFETYCYDCHANGARKGGLALDELIGRGKDDANAAAEWGPVWKTLRHEFMPPADADRPSDEERRAMARWIEREAFRIDESKPDPGRVTIRRLNRMEYHHTVRDLFGIDLDIAREVPPDDTAFGFDNIGDALTLSPALLETYLNLAEKVVANVVADGPRRPRIDLDPRRFRNEKPREGRVEQIAEVELKHAGRYRAEVQFRLGGFRATTGDYDVRMDFGGTRLAEQAVNDGGEKTYVLGGEVDLPAGRYPLTLTTTPKGAKDEGEDGDGRDGRRSLTLFPRATVTGPLDADVFEYPEAHRRIFFDGAAPEDPAARRAYARAILARIADRAFRRPAGEATVDRLADIAMEGGPFEAGVARAITAVLSSPRFFFRAELQPNPDEPAEVRPLDDFALASRLSYLLWLSLPDDELTRLAAEGKLRDDVPNQLRRMLADPKSARFFEDFAGQWLRTRNILLAPLNQRDLGRIDPIRVPMKRETEMLFEHVAREGRDLVELLTADYSFLNGRLAEHYGVEGIRGDEMRLVKLPPESRRGGLLTHGSLLISTSNPGRTSPVKRGVFVLENLLGKEVPPPPPDVGDLDDARVDGRRPRTLREQLAVHREQASCASCHAHFDPIGLAMENYDHLGRWREKERSGEPVDATATLVTGEAVDGATELERALAARPEAFYRCVAEKLLTYALGRGLEPSDAPAVETIVARTAAGGGSFPAMLSAVVDSVPFRSRRGDSGEAVASGRSDRFAPPPPERRGAAGRSMAAAERRAKLEAEEREREGQEAGAGRSSAPETASPGEDRP